MYGNLVFCYKQKHLFNNNEILLSNTIGNNAAQSLTVHRLIETDILLDQEKLKTEFIANATHELRTPLAIIKGNVDLAMESDEMHRKSPRSAFRAINQEIRRLSDILSDLTQMNDKSEELKNKMVLKEVNLKSLINRAISRTRSLSYKKNISITSSDIPNLTIEGDRTHLGKMLVNIIKNSITYGNQGGHTKIRARASKGRIIIDISDDGIGISKDDLPHIFERFYRADKSRNSSGHSRGLGLAIVKWIAEIHNGTVSAKSIKSKGSTFTIILPIKSSKK